MKKAFNISKYAATLNQPGPAETVRDIEAVTCEILHLKQELARNIVDIGLRLIEAKEMLPHGEWLPWLKENVCFTDRTAEKYMLIAREFPNSNLVADLGVRKALALLELPPSERESFAEENNVIDMTSRELEKAIRERDEARRAAEAAQADARSAEESRAKMEADMKALEEIHRSAQEGEAQARDALAKAQAELKELRERPVDVAVEVDREAVEKARAEAVAEMQQKLTWAEKERERAEKALLKATKALDAANKTAGANAAILSRAEKAEAELAEARRQLEAAEKAEKASIVNQNGDLAMFNVLFSQTQEQVNKMHGLRLKLGKGDEDLDTKLKTAINALADAVRRCAE